TPGGKAVAARNSFKHGLCARDVIIDSEPLKEDRAEYELLLDSLVAELQPQSVFQEYLVRKIANCLWRSRRAVRAETAHLNDRLDDAVNIRDRIAALYRACDEDNDDADDSPSETASPDDNASPEEPPTSDDDDREMSDLVGRHSIPASDFNRNLLYYEMRLDRQLTRAYTLLRRLQLYEQAKSLQDRRDANKKRENEPISLYVSPP
ncbi:MAG: hypothetical protein OEW00_12600, partial [candidate division Zixibacteria bacterium]|nr:hypothetical protein [candidate division Zixibacteria bacterium]